MTWVWWIASLYEYYNPEPCLAMLEKVQKSDWSWIRNYMVHQASNQVFDTINIHTSGRGETSIATMN